MNVKLHASLLTFAAMVPLGVAIPAIPAHAATDSAVATIGSLEAQGFDVRIDRVGNAPLDQCEVTSVRNPQTQTKFVRIIGRGDDNFVPVVVRRSITVSLDCSR